MTPRRTSVILCLALLLSGSAQAARGKDSWGILRQVPAGQPVLFALRDLTELLTLSRETVEFLLPRLPQQLDSGDTPRAELEAALATARATLQGDPLATATYTAMGLQLNRGLAVVGDGTSFQLVVGCADPEQLQATLKAHVPGLTITAEQDGAHQILLLGGSPIVPPGSCLAFKDGYALFAQQPQRLRSLLELKRADSAAADAALATTPFGRNNLARLRLNLGSPLIKLMLGGDSNPLIPSFFAAALDLDRSGAVLSTVVGLSAGLKGMLGSVLRLEPGAPGIRGALAAVDPDWAVRVALQPVLVTQFTAELKASDPELFSLLTEHDFDLEQDLLSQLGGELILGYGQQGLVLGLDFKTPAAAAACRDKLTRLLTEIAAQDYTGEALIVTPVKLGRGVTGQRIRSGAMGMMEDGMTSILFVQGPRLFVCTQEQVARKVVAGRGAKLPGLTSRATAALKDAAHPPQLLSLRVGNPFASWRGPLLLLAPEEERAQLEQVLDLAEAVLDRFFAASLDLQRFGSILTAGLEISLSPAKPASSARKYARAITLKEQKERAAYQQYKKLLAGLAREPLKNPYGRKARAAVSTGADLWTTSMLGVLAAVAIPAFLQYQERAEQVGGHEALHQILAAEEAHLLEHDRYLAAPLNPPTPGGAWDPKLPGWSKLGIGAPPGDTTHIRVVVTDQGKKLRIELLEFPFAESEPVVKSWLDEQGMLHLGPPPAAQPSAGPKPGSPAPAGP